MYFFENFLDWGSERYKDSIEDVVTEFSDYSNELLVSNKKNFLVAGRVKSIRNFGKLCFVVIFDGSKNGINLQLKITDDNFNKKVGQGDIIVATGFLFRTKTNELTLDVKNVRILSVCLNKIPSEYYGLSDKETALRKRWLDFIVNPKKKEKFFFRHDLILFLRNFLNNLGYIEIETPVLVNSASGAQAKPFVTYHNKLRKNFFLRIATEISLKKLLICGFEKIYEIGKIFRNEGIDSTHNPEFTTVEVYCAYKKSSYMMEITEKIFFSIKNHLGFNHEILSKDGKTYIDLTKKFRRATINELIKEKINVDFSSIKLEEALKLSDKFDVKLNDFQKKSVGFIVFAFFENFVEKNIIQPTFVYDYPLEVSPLSKRKEGKRNIADRFELYINGMEFANGYTELDDPFEQKQRFLEQMKQKESGNDEIASLDEEFVEALEYAMPPSAGLGIGIDRLIMFFTNSKSIKEIISFPQLKEKEE